ncbi:MAG: hypothetical protein IT462_08465 [Planctomycetes bacterium]|nr:hypothetical protein [Planctomycetota bacterium]
MSITYLIDLPCPVKKHVPASRIMRLVYEREQALLALNRARKKNVDVDAADVHVRLTLKDKQGKAHAVKTTVAAVSIDYAELEPHGEHCKACPARVHKQAFGCRGVLDFPVTLKGEALLMGMIHGVMDDPGPKVLLNYLDSNGILGHQVEEMRRTGDIFFQSKKPLVRRYENDVKLSANQLFELLFLSGTITWQHGRFLLGLMDLYEANLPLIAPLDSFKDKFVYEHMRDGKPSYRNAIKIVSSPEDDNCERQIKDFLRALFLACEMECSLRVVL